MKSKHFMLLGNIPLLELKGHEIKKGLQACSDSASHYFKYTAPGYTSRYSWQRSKIVILESNSYVKCILTNLDIPR